MSTGHASMNKLAEALTEKLAKEHRVSILVTGFYSADPSSQPFMTGNFSPVSYRDLAGAFALDPESYQFLLSTKSVFWTNDEMPCPIASLCNLSMDKLGTIHPHELLPLILGGIDTRLIPSAT